MCTDNFYLICKRLFKSHTNLQIRRNFKYVRYYPGIPKLHVSLGFPFIETSFLLCPIDFYRLCSRVYSCLIVVSMGPLSALDPKSCCCPCAFKKKKLCFWCACYNSVALVHFGHKEPHLVIKF